MLATHERSRQLGITLVELMIAMVIGLVIVGVAGQLLLSGKRSVETQAGTGAIQEGGRFSLYFLQRDIRMAGFPRTFGPSSSQPPANAFVTANTTDGASGASDQIQVMYNSDPRMPDSDEDCLGQESATVASGGCAANPSDRDNDGNCSWRVTNHYFVNNGALMCRGIGNAAAQQIIQGVEGMQILYGVDTNNDTYADVYRNATAVTAADWSRIAAVRVSLLVASTDKMADSADAGKYALLDAAEFTSTNLTGTTVDERLMRRQVFTTTIEIRNHTQ